MAVSIPLMADSKGAPVKYTGAPIDGGQDCTACHRANAPANSDPRGSITIQAGPYTPNVKQTIQVTVQHPDAMRWGFQLTARALNDLTKMAGSFTPSEEVRVRCDPASGRDAPPCESALQFADQNEASMLTGDHGTKTFLVDWTPPNNEVGDIILYAAGDAATNNTATPAGRIYTASLRISAQGACTLLKKPTLRNVVDAASFKPVLGMNTLATIFGIDFQLAGNSRLAGPGDIHDNKFPTQLGCAAVEIAGQRVPVTYIQTDQINVQLPTLPAAGNAEVRVVLNPGQPTELRSDVGTIAIQNYSPAFFTFNGTSIAALFPNSTQAVADPAIVAGGRPAQPGDIISLYATGLGPTNPPYQPGEIVARSPLPYLRDPITVMLGGTILAAPDVIYAGGTPGSISGLYQINIRIPASTPNGDIPVVLTIGGISSQNNATIPVKRPL